MSDTEKADALRLDKWLWFARFVRTRSLATKLVVEGNMRINGAPTQKAHHGVKPGDVLTFALGRHIRIIRVLALAARRGPAPEAQALYEDLDPPRPQPTREPALAQRESGAGRPTKRDRRQIAALKQPRE